jgi:hypothetical protein
MFEAIKNAKDAIRFFRAMADLGLLYHPDDNPRDIIEMYSRKKLFSKVMCNALERRMNEIHDLDIDPCDMVLKVIEERSAKGEI